MIVCVQWGGQLGSPFAATATMEDPSLGAADYVISYMSMHIIDTANYPVRLVLFARCCYSLPLLVHATWPFMMHGRACHGRDVLVFSGQQVYF